MKEGYSDLTFVLDRSGSMWSIAKDMEGGLAKFIEEQKLVKGECKVSLIQFDEKIETVFSGLALETIAAIKVEPRGSTALYDAVGRAIDEAGARFRKLKEKDRPERVTFVIITDGFENASKEYSAQKINEMITHQRDVYKWEFVFLGANQDSILTAQTLGININNAYNFSADPKSVEAGFYSLNQGYTVMRSTKGVSQVDNLLNIGTDSLVTKK